MKTYKLNPEYLPQDLENVTRIDNLVTGSVDIADAMQQGEEGTPLDIRKELQELNPVSTAQTDEIIQMMIDKEILIEVEDLSPAHEQDCRDAIVAALTSNSMPLDKIHTTVKFGNRRIKSTLRHLVLSNIVTLDSYNDNGVVSYTID